jgi:hypothetical protein
VRLALPILGTWNRSTVMRTHRVIAYAPQIRGLTRGSGNAAAVSLIARTLFSVANAATAMLKRLMLAWQRSKQNRLELHLRLTIPAGRLKHYDALFPALSADDRYRHHPYIRD